MGLFRKRREPVQVGASLVVFGAVGRVDAVQFSHDQAPREVISALAPITMVISRAVSLSGTRAHVWLTAATAHEDAATLNRSVGTSTIGELSPTDQRQPDAHGVFYVTQESKLVGTWSCAFTDDSSGLRVLGALWEWATRSGEGEVVGYALEAVRSTYETVDWGNPGIMNDMPQMLLDYGAHQAALGRMKFPDDDVPF